MTTFYHRFTQKADNTPVTGDNYTGNGGSTRNNRGIVRRGGVIASPRWTSKGIAADYIPVGPIVYDSSALPGNRKLVDKAVSAGRFAVLQQGEYVIRRVSRTLGGEANTTLLSGGSDFAGRRSIHRSEIWNTSFLYGIEWVAGQGTIDDPTPNHPAVTFTVVTRDTEFGQDSTATNPASQGEYDLASRPTIEHPGQLVYKSSRPNPVKDLYKARSMF